MKKFTMLAKEINERDVMIGTSFAGLVINASLEMMLNTLGDPSVIGSGDNKAQLTWIYYTKLEESTYECMTIYDYKENVPIHGIHNWHIGSKHISKEAIRENLMAIGFNELEIKDY